MSEVCRVLVVDDDPTLLATVSQALEDEDYAVATAADGAEALDVYERFRPGVVLLDMRMPVLDGWGFVREAERRRFDATIVVMTAAADARAWAAEVRAAEHLPKPFDLDDLYAVVERVCAKARPGATGAPDGSARKL